MNGTTKERCLKASKKHTLKHKQAFSRMNMGSNASFVTILRYVWFFCCTVIIYCYYDAILLLIIRNNAICLKDMFVFIWWVAINNKKVLFYIEVIGHYNIRCCFLPFLTVFKKKSSFGGFWMFVPFASNNLGFILMKSLLSWAKHLNF